LNLMDKTGFSNQMGSIELTPASLMLTESDGRGTGEFVNENMPQHLQQHQNGVVGKHQSNAPDNLTQ
jgi:hypothetical protein